MKRKRTIIPGKSYYVTVRTDGGRKYLEAPLAKTMFVDMLARLEARRACRIDNSVVLDERITSKACLNGLLWSFQETRSF